VSSATRGPEERGQVLAIFAGGVLALLLAAALAFDGGMVLLEKRDQQNAADAAAIAGARFLPRAPSVAISRSAAIATANGFSDGLDTADVDITVGSWSPNGGFVPAGGSGAIEVVIGSTRPAIFAGVVGKTGWDVSSRAIAVNQDSTDGPFALLSLDPTACPAIVVEGSGILSSSGNIQVNSVCDTGDAAFRVAGSGALQLQGEGIGCNIVGDWTSGGGIVRNDCNPPNLGQTEIPDPYSSWPDPPMPPPPKEMLLVDNPDGGPEEPPAGCPGSDDAEATADDPALCLFEGNRKGQTWRVFPGYYPGGLSFGGGCVDGPDAGGGCDSATDTWATFLLEPGVYYIGGGGFRVANATLRSVDIGGTTLGGGVLIFNSNFAPVPGGTPMPRQLVLQGGHAGVQLWPLVGTGEYAAYDRFVIYQDRDLPVVTPCDDANEGSTACEVEIVGGASDMEVRGIIYVPSAHVRVEGNAGTLTLDQAIANTFSTKGSTGTINVAYDDDFLPNLQFAGLVE
jgi:hypothetical protein